MPRHKVKRKTHYLQRIKRPSAFRNPGGEITEVDLLRLADKTGLSYQEIHRIYEAMKNKKFAKAG